MLFSQFNILEPSYFSCEGALREAEVFSSEGLVARVFLSCRRAALEQGSSSETRDSTLQQRVLAGMLKELPKGFKTSPFLAIDNLARFVILLFSEQAGVDLLRKQLKTLPEKTELIESFRKLQRYPLSFDDARKQVEEDPRVLIDYVDDHRRTLVEALLESCYLQTAASLCIEELKGVQKNDEVKAFTDLKGRLTYIPLKEAIFFKW